VAVHDLQEAFAELCKQYGMDDYGIVS
jgi:hypothetical protein